MTQKTTSKISIPTGIIFKNSGRQPELDIARGLAVIFMVLIHTCEYYWDYENVVFDKIANFLGSPPSAPVFMFLLGCGIVYSRKSDPKTLCKRGLKMLFLSYIFNALVYVLPYGIYSLIHKDPSLFADSWTQIYDVDILQFAALAFLFFAITGIFKLNAWLIAIIAAAISGIGIILNIAVPEIENNVLQAITGLFIGSHEGSYFPFSSWILYPAAGYLFATYLKNTENKKKFYTKVSLIGGAVYLILTFVILKFHEWDNLMDGEIYYHQGLPINIMVLGFVLFWLGLCYALYHILPKKIIKFLETCSINVTPMYVCQYILIIYMVILPFGEEASFNTPITIAIFVVYTIGSYFMSIVYKNYKKRFK